MAPEPHDDFAQRAKKEEPGYGGNAQGVLGEQEQRPGLGQKIKQSLSNMKNKITESSDDDPQQQEPHPHEGHRPNGGVHHPLPPAVGHNPEFEPQGVGVLAADSVMPEFLHLGSTNEHSSSHHPPGSTILRHTDRQTATEESVPRGIGEGDLQQEQQQPKGYGVLKDLVTGQSPGQGSGTGLATIEETRAAGQQEKGVGQGTQPQLPQTTDRTTGIEGTKSTGTAKPGGNTHVTQFYAQEPTPLTEGSDCFGSLKHKLRHFTSESHQASNPEWPTPANPGSINEQGAVGLDEEGTPMEGPKEEGDKHDLVTKIMEKLHIAHQKPTTSTDQIPTPAASKGVATHQ